jgi:hypothetical protein
LGFVSDESGSLPPRASLDFLYEHLKDGLAAQYDGAGSLDAKAVQSFAATSVVIGLAAAGGGRSGAEAWLIGAAIVFYVVAVAATVFVLWVRRFRVSDDADQIWERYWQADVADIKHALLADIADGYRENDGLLSRKRKGLAIALICGGLEAALVGASLITAL